MNTSAGQCCGSGSGIRDPVPFWPLDPGSGLGFFRIPDSGSGIPNPYFWELSDTFLGKKFYNYLKIGPNVFLQHFKNKIVQFCEIYGSKNKAWQQIFSPLSFICCFWILEPGSEIRGIREIRGMCKNQDPGSGINIPDPQHCRKV